ncbi:translocation/assembly module TamB domain-containing protein [Pontiellaceae bacterium B1224]|nr:translocation/assembly module TamB domain-containing protein [Pontiellaceae bacterium B1224]
MKRKRFRVWKWFVVLLLLAPLLLFAFLQTPFGKTLLAKSLSTALSRSGTMEIRIGEITGWLPMRVTISELEVGDAEGIWISIRELHCRWLVEELRHSRVRFRKLSADQVVWHRFPSYGKSDTEKKKEPSGFEPFELVLDGLNVNMLTLEKAVAGIPLNYAVHSGEVHFLTSGELTGQLLVSGDATGRVELDALLTGSVKDQLAIKVELDELTHPTFGLDQLSGRGEAVIQSGKVNAVITANLEYAGQPGRLATRLHYEKQQLSLQQLQLSTDDFGLSGDLSLGFTNHTIEVALDSTFVDVSTNQFDVLGHAVYSRSNKTWNVAVPALEIRGWDALSFTLAGQLNPNQAALSGTLAEVDVGKIPVAGSSNFTGQVNGSVHVTGPLDNPEVLASLTIEQFASTKQALDELPELDFSITGGVSDGKIYGKTSITKYTSGHLKADFNMPCTFSLLPFRYKPAPDGFDANVDANLDLTIFNQLAIFQDQFISGKLQSKVAFTDRVPSGYLRIQQGRYEHYNWGVVFRGFDADLSATDGGFVINHATASDGGEGTLTMTGGLGRSGLGLNLALSNAWVLRREELDAEVSGQLNVSGSPLRPDISGELTINRAELLLDNAAADPPPVLTSFDRNATNAAPRAVQQKKRRAFPVGLDVKVLMPDQIFVNASMIDAVLGGNLHITDTLAGLSVKGEIEPKRGYVDFIGKKFRFTDGSIRLDGSVPTLATLDELTAEYTRRDVTARLVLNGPVTDPSFRLESTPAMPEDEVLSHVLFNRDTSSISPYQAVQIAMAARQLSGGMNGPGFMYQVRKAIGIDTLEWREAAAAGEASSVAAGKYITSGLYVELNQTLDKDSDTEMMAELEVTRHFSVETYTGPELRPGIGVNWRNDY